MKMIAKSVLFLVSFTLVQSRPQSLGSRNNPVGGFRPIINNNRNSGKEKSNTVLSNKAVIYSIYFIFIYETYVY